MVRVLIFDSGSEGVGSNREASLLLGLDSGLLEEAATGPDLLQRYIFSSFPLFFFQPRNFGDLLLLTEIPSSLFSRVVRYLLKFQHHLIEISAPYFAKIYNNTTVAELLLKFTIGQPCFL